MDTYRVVQVDSTTDFEVLYMLLKRWYSEYKKKSVRQQREYVHFRRLIQVDPVGPVCTAQKTT